MGLKGVHYVFMFFYLIYINSNILYIKGKMIRFLIFFIYFIFNFLSPLFILILIFKLFLNKNIFSTVIELA